MKFKITSPKSDSEFKKYYQLRWEILRKPWNQPVGSEKDDNENESFHVAAFDEAGGILGVGRLHFNSAAEAQIRYMAVKKKGLGIGSRIVETLEKHATETGAKYIILNSRENAVNFYKQNGYMITQKGPVLFGIKHFIMKKELNTSLISSIIISIIISIDKQNLSIYTGSELLKVYKVSTSKYGIGNEEGSYRTPVGIHRICFAKGAEEKIGMIFKNGVPTGNVAEIDPDNTSEDLITSRVLGLEGCEPGINDNSKKRGILIHGTQDEKSIGRPASHGCIRMKNPNIIELFFKVTIGTIVEIRR